VRVLTDELTVSHKRTLSSAPTVNSRHSSSECFNFQDGTAETAGLEIDGPNSRAVKTTGLGEKPSGTILHVPQPCTKGISILYGGCTDN